MSQQRLVLALALVTSACAENRSSFFIQHVVVPSAECVIEGSEDALFQTSGILDVAYQEEYWLTPLLRNQLTARGDPDNLTVETNGIQVEGANIRIWRGGRPQGQVIYPFYQPAASYVPPNNVSPSSFVAIPDVAIGELVQLAYGTNDIRQVPIAEAMSFEDLVTVGVVMLGTTNGGAELETPEFYFPVRICFGCLTTCPADSANPEEGLDLCEDLESIPERTSCRGGQDSLLDCRYCTPVYGGPTCREFCTLF